jgi:hypothetical protein
VLGWLISVHRVADEDAVRRALAAEAGVKVVLGDNALGDRLAVWQAGIDGRQWIRQAASREGGVVRELESGYPHRYLARAADILPTIRDRVPYKAPMFEYPSWVVPGGSVLLPGYVGKTTIDQGAIDNCPVQGWLYIEVWDES